MNYGRPSYGFQGGRSAYNDRGCREFAATGYCKFGNTCKFIHDMRPQADFGGPPSHGPPPGESRKQAALYKTKMCPKWEHAGSCSYGTECTFAHGQHELQNFKGFDAASQPPHHQQQQQQQRQQQQHYGAAGQYGSSPADTQGEFNAGYHQQQQRQQRYDQQHAASAQQQQHFDQQQPGIDQQQQQQPPPVPGLSKPLPGVVTYVDRVRAMCSVLSIGAAGELVTEESLQHAARAFKRGVAFKENKFADSVEAYIPIA